MTKQKFTIDERFAFWEAYDKKCIYCSRPILEISQLEIDHLLPESLSKDNLQFQTILQEHKLPPNYTLTEYYNLVASCASCNRKKGKNTNLIINSINLSTADKKADAVEKLIRKFRKKCVANLETQPTTVPFQFMFRNRLIKGPISKSRLVDLYDLPVDIGTIEDFTLTGKTDNDRSSIIETVTDYNAALEKGYHAGTTFEMHMSWSFEIASAFLQAIEGAQLPRISYLSDDYFLFTNLKQISAKVAERPGCCPEPIDSFDLNMTLKELKHDPVIKSITCDNESFSVYFNDEGEAIFGPRFLSYTELLRADFTGDGYEEILCYYYNCTGGSLRYWGLALLQKQNPNDLINCGRFKNSET